MAFDAFDDGKDQRGSVDGFRPWLDYPMPEERRWTDIFGLLGAARFDRIVQRAATDTYLVRRLVTALVVVQGV
jgi:hypothetical protein